MHRTLCCKSEDECGTVFFVVAFEVLAGSCKYLVRTATVMSLLFCLLRGRPSFSFKYSSSMQAWLIQPCRFFSYVNSAVVSYALLPLGFRNVNSFQHLVLTCSIYSHEKFSLLSFRFVK
jgi:hypothetical protein